MIVLPAIDIRGGQCVRLIKGDFATAHKVAADPFETAGSFREAGAVWLHMVDLDGAVQGERVNAALFTRMAAESGLRLELGGGIRDREAVEFYLQHGIERVILGSAALENPMMVREVALAYPGRIAVGIDALNRRVATRGWLDQSDVDFIELAQKMESFGVKHIIFTDISRDGTLSGPSLEQLCALRTKVSCAIIASGGVANIDDIAALADAGMSGVICGKALYAGTLSLKEAIVCAGEQKEGAQHAV